MKRRLFGLFGGSEENKAPALKEDPKPTAPIQTIQPRQLPRGQVSRDDSNVGNMVQRLFQQYASLAYQMPWELLEYLDLLSRWNPDFSQAIGNIRRLGNTGYDVIVEARTEGEKSRIKERIGELSAKVNKLGGGIDGAVNALFDSGATFGALAMEWVPNKQLDDIEDVILVPVKTIRFKKDKNVWMPFQKVPFGTQGADKDGLIALNPFTFIYRTVLQHPGSPYGLPPFLGALDPIAIQRDMSKNVRMAMKKVGLLGILDFMVHDIQRLPDEDEDAYQTRCLKALEEYAKRFTEMASTGALVHFKNDAEVQSMTMAGQNVAGAKQLWEMNEEQAFSGMQTTPAMHGRSYSTTETYAGVLYQDMLSQVENYRRSIKRSLEEGYRLACLLWGENPTKIKVDFNPNNPLNRLYDAEAEQIELDIAIKMRNENFIDQEGAAHRVGLDKPAGPAPARPIFNPFQQTDNQPNQDPNAGQEGNQNPDQGQNKAKKKLTPKQYAAWWIKHALHKSECSCHVCKANRPLEPEDPLWREMQLRYYNILIAATAKCEKKVWEILQLPDPGDETKAVTKDAAEYTPEQIKKLKQAINQYLINDLTTAAPGDIAPLEHQYMLTYSAGLYSASQEAGLETPLLDIVQRRRAVNNLRDNGFELVRSNAKLFRNELVDILATGMENGRSPYDNANQMFKAFRDLEDVNWDRLARTEVAMILNQAKRDEWEEEGITEMEYSPNPDACPICLSLAGVYSMDECPQPVDDTHPNCLCGLKLVTGNKAAMVNIQAAFDFAETQIKRLKAA